MTSCLENIQTRLSKGKKNVPWSFVEIMSVLGVRNYCAMLSQLPFLICDQILNSAGIYLIQLGRQSHSTLRDLTVLNANG